MIAGGLTIAYLICMNTGFSNVKNLKWKNNPLEDINFLRDTPYSGWSGGRCDTHFGFVWSCESMVIGCWNEVSRGTCNMA